jgi:hypothetical protein
MARLLIHVEGQTEEGFVNDILRNHLVGRGYHSVEARIIGNARQRERRGGIRAWHSVRTDIINHLKEDQACIATTMVDYYALPQQGPGAWPGRARSATLGTIEEKARCVEAAVRDDLAAEMDSRFDPDRFVPFVVMHEFEGLLFSDCAAFSRAIGRSDLEHDFQRIRDEFATPEEIDDSPNTAPSKRVEVLLRGYQKPLFGVLAVLEIGLSAIRTECPHFDGWLKRLESLP